MSDLIWFTDFDGSPIAFKNFEDCFAYFGGQDYKEFKEFKNKGHDVYLYQYPRLERIYEIYSRFWSKDGTKN